MIRRTFKKRCDVGDNRSLEIITVCDKTGLKVGSAQCEKDCVFFERMSSTGQVVFCADSSRTTTSPS